MTGYMRLRQICLVAPQLAPVIADISAIMGLDVCYRDGNVAKYGLENALLPVDTILLEVVAPFQPGPGTAAGRFIEKTGGRGGYMGTIIGALILTLVLNGMNLLSVSANWQPLVTGIIVILAVWLDMKTRRRAQ